MKNKELTNKQLTELMYFIADESSYYNNPIGYGFIFNIHKFKAKLDNIQQETMDDN